MNMENSEVLRIVNELIGFSFNIQGEIEEIDLDHEKINFNHYENTKKLSELFELKLLEGETVWLKSIQKILIEGLSHWSKIGDGFNFLITDTVSGEKHRINQSEFKSLSGIKIDYLKELVNRIQVLLIDESKLTEPKKSLFKINEKKGSKIDLIRIFSALHELKFIEKQDGFQPTKKEFIETVGEFLGTDFSKFNQDLSQAFKNGSIESNIEIFERLKNITIEAKSKSEEKNK